MLQDPPKSLSAETIRRIASEQAGLALKASEVEALTTLLEGLRTEVGLLKLEDRAGAEPEPLFELEAWDR